MFQSRTHTCSELRLSDVGKTVTLVGWYENMRKVSKNLGFLILRDFYGTTQAVIETEEMMAKLSGVNNESTLSVTGVVRERSSKNANLPTGEIEVVPTDIQVLGRCRYNELPFEINRSKEADENTRLKIPLSRPEKPGGEGPHHPALQCGGGASKEHDRARLSGDHHADSDLLLPGGRKGLPGSLPEPSGQVLRPAPGAPAVQAAPDDGRL